MRGVAKLVQLKASSPLGLICFDWHVLPCALGPAGVGATKHEGDGATPRGLWPSRGVLYRPDKVGRLRTSLPLKPLKPSDGWCDAAGDRNYNRCVELPYAASAESLWRQDSLYDIIVILGFNDRPRVSGKGSAIFMHIARPGYQPTAGCVALKRDDLLRLIENPWPIRWLDTRPPG